MHANSIGPKGKLLTTRPGPKYDLEDTNLIPEKKNVKK